jgi:hypothetical protein
MAHLAHSWGWGSLPMQEGHYPWADADQSGSIMLLEHDDLLSFESDQTPEPSSEPALEQLSVMISNRLEQALEIRRLEDQLASLNAQLDLAIEAYRLAASNESATDISKTWQGYLVSLLADGPLARDQALRAMNLWETLRSAVGDLNPPHAAALENGTFSMAWDMVPHHFEVELQPGGLFDWFYLDRATDRIEGEQDLTIGYVAPSMIELLRKAAL